MTARVTTANRLRRVAQWQIARSNLLNFAALHESAIGTWRLSLRCIKFRRDGRYSGHRPTPGPDRSEAYDPTRTSNQSHSREKSTLRVTQLEEVRCLACDPRRHTCSSSFSYDSCQLRPYRLPVRNLRQRRIPTSSLQTSIRALQFPFR